MYSLDWKELSYSKTKVPCYIIHNLYYNNFQMKDHNFARYHIRYEKSQSFSTLEDGFLSGSLIPRNSRVLRNPNIFPCIHSIPSLIPSLQRLYNRKKQFIFFFSRRTWGLLSLFLWVPDQTASLLQVSVIKDFSNENVNTNQARTFFIFIFLTNYQLLIREFEKINLKRI